jgi:mannose-6-phosphate isomerase-like protein (cupin superfamily)
MTEGQIVHPSSGETITCIRSGQSGGPFIFDLELAPGTGGPPTHSHDQGDETVEVLEGEMTFRVNGKKKILRAGDALTLTPSDTHTFWNASKSQVVKARVTHGSRFERLIVQPSITAILMYATYVDPGASRPANPVVKLVARIVARIGRLRGVEMVGVPEAAPGATT